MENHRESPPGLADLHEVILKRGLAINLLMPLILLGIGYVLREAGIVRDTPLLDDEMHRLLLYILGAIAIGELAMAVYLKKRILNASQFLGTGGSFPVFAERCRSKTILIFLIAASPAIYGFVLFVLGGTIEQFVFFLLISLVGFRLTRPGKDDLEKLWLMVSGADSDSYS